jgi:hypothetical protein
MKANIAGTPCVVAMALTAVPVLKSAYNPRSGPTMGMNIIKHMRKLFPKMYCTIEPLWVAVVIVWFSSSLIWRACWASTGTKLPITVTMTATIITAIIE